MSETRAGCVREIITKIIYMCGKNPDCPYRQKHKDPGRFCEAMLPNGQCWDPRARTAAGWETEGRGGE